MHSMISRGLGRAALRVAGVAVLAISASAFASASAEAAGTVKTVPSPSSGPGSSSATGSPSGSATPSASASASGSAVATVMTKTGPMGTYLVDGQGRSLYLFLADTGTTSHCSGACAEQWPPLTSNGAPKAGQGATANKLGTTTRSDGTKQVTYNGHPLYRFSVDQNPGDTKGQGLNAFGALWWLVSPAGSSITTTSSGQPSGSGSAPGSSGGATSGGGGPGGPGY